MCVCVCYLKKLPVGVADLNNKKPASENVVFGARARVVDVSRWNLLDVCTSSAGLLEAARRLFFLHRPPH